MKLLVETGMVDVQSTDKKGQMALSLAAEKGHEAVVKLLLKTGKVNIGSPINTVIYDYRGQQGTGMRRW